MPAARTIRVFIASPGRRSQEVINREIDRCAARRLGLRPDRIRIRMVGTESQPTRKRSADPGPQLQKVLDFRKSLEESRQVLSHGFANEAEFKAEVDRHLRAFAKGELPPANAPRDKVLLPLAVIAEVQKEKAEKEQALARAECGLRFKRETRRFFGATSALSFLCYAPSLKLYRPGR